MSRISRILAAIGWDHSRSLARSSADPAGDIEPQANEISIERWIQGWREDPKARPTFSTLWNLHCPTCDDHLESLLGLKLVEALAGDSISNVDGESVRGLVLYCLRCNIYLIAALTPHRFLRDKQWPISSIQLAPLPSADAHEAPNEVFPHGCPGCDSGRAIVAGIPTRRENFGFKCARCGEEWRISRWGHSDGFTWTRKYGKANDHRSITRCSQCHSERSWYSVDCGGMTEYRCRACGVTQSKGW